MEVEEAVRKAIQRRREGDSGKSFDQNNYAIASYGREWEKYAHSLPTYRTHAQPIQNPDGTFKFVAGLDALGAQPLGGG